MSILQEYEAIKKQIGEEKYKQLNMYLTLNPETLISDVYYKEKEWGKFEEWCTVIDKFDKAAIPAYDNVTTKDDFNETIFTGAEIKTINQYLSSPFDLQNEKGEVIGECKKNDCIGIWKDWDDDYERVFDYSTHEVKLKPFIKDDKLYYIYHQNGIYHIQEYKDTDLQKKPYLKFKSVEDLQKDLENNGFRSNHLNKDIIYFSDQYFQSYGFDMGAFAPFEITTETGQYKEIDIAIRENNGQLLFEVLDYHNTDHIKYKGEQTMTEKKQYATGNYKLTVDEFIRSHPKDIVNLLSPGGYIKLMPDNLHDISANTGWSAPPRIVDWNEIKDQIIDTEGALKKDGEWNFISEINERSENNEINKNQQKKSTAKIDDEFTI